MEEIYSWIRNIVIYMIINTIVMNLLGNKSYKKYVSIVSGMILVLIVVSPLIKIMKLEPNLDYYIEANDFAVEASNFKNDLLQMEEQQVDIIFAEYKEKIRTQVADMISDEKVQMNNFNIHFDQEPTSATFGEIINMEIEASIENNEDEGKKRNLQIEDIEISKISIGADSNKEEEILPSPLEIEIKNKLSDFYNMEQDNINISIQGG